MRLAILTRFASLSRLFCALARHRGASAMVETAFTLPILLLFIFGTVETGRLMWMRTALSMAVEDAARYASVTLPSCGTTAQVETYAEGRTWGLQFPLTDFQLVTPNPSCGCNVTATATFTPIINLVPYSVSLNSQACFPIWN